MVITNNDVERGLQTAFDKEQRINFLERISKELPLLFGFLTNQINRELESLGLNETTRNRIAEMYLKIFCFAIGTIWKANNEWLIDFIDCYSKKMEEFCCNKENLKKELNRSINQLKKRNLFFYGMLNLMLKQYTFSNSPIQIIIWLILDILIGEIEKGDKILKDFSK